MIPFKRITENGMNSAKKSISKLVQFQEKFMAQDILTRDRVYQHTDPKINDKIMQDLKKSVLFYEKNQDQIESRLEELNKEWDIERLLELNASIISLFGVLGVAFGKKYYILLPFTVLYFLIQHAIQGWCPPIELFRRLGIRTKEEISRERNLLKAIRGDYDTAAQLRSSDGYAHIENLYSLFKA